MTWLLLRGLTRQALHWGRFPSELRDSLALRGIASEVLTLDLPGNGEFAQVKSPPVVSAMVDFVRQQLQQTGRRPPYQVLGMSLGGMVAVNWAQRYPDELGRLVLINTSMKPFSRLTQRLRPGNWLALVLLAVRWHEADYAEQVVHQLTCRRLDMQRSDIAEWARIRKIAPVSQANAQRQLWAAARFACAPAAPKCPVLVLSSGADQLVNPACSEQLSDAWCAAHQQHPWAGHDLPHDDGAWVCKAVTDWISN